MGRAAILAIARAEARRRWRSLLALAVVAGVVGGVVMATAAGTRRSDTAFDRLLEHTDHPELLLQVLAPPDDLGEALARRPDVERVRATQMAVGAHLGFESLAYVPVASAPEAPFDPLVVRGRMWDPAAVDELVVSEGFADELGLDLGDVVPWHGLSHEQFLAFGEGFDGYDGPRVDLRVVGLTNDPRWATGGEPPVLLGTPAFHAAHAASLPDFQILWLDLSPDADHAAVVDAAQELVAAEALSGAPVVSRIEASLLADERRAIDDAVGVLVVALIAVGAAALVAGTFVVGQAVGRHLLGRGVDDRYLRALGLTRRERTTALVLAGVSTLPVTAAVSIALAIGLSPLFPLGIAREVEPAPGIEVNLALVIGGSVAVAAAVLVIWLLGAARHVRAAPAGSGAPVRPSRTAQLVSGRARVPEVVGTRMAFEAGAGTTAVPVRAARVSVAVGLAGVTAVLLFAASLDRLVNTPSKWGRTATTHVELTDDVRAGTVATLTSASEVESLAVVTVATIEVGGRTTGAYAIDVRKGSLEPTVFEGRLPSGPDEVTLGPELLDDLGLEVGDEVSAVAPAGEGSADLRVVGSALSFASDADTHSTGAFLTHEGLRRLAQTEIFVTGHVILGADADSEVVHRLLGGLEFDPGAMPSDVSNLAALGNLPELLAAFLALLAAGALGHAVVVASRRRRADLALLRSLGLLRSETTRAVVVMALSIVVAGAVVGVPIGLALGNVAWRTVTDALYVAGGLEVPPWAVAIPVGAVAVAVVTALVAARLVGRATPARLLRAE